MADIVDARTRSRMMSAVKGKNTRYEIDIRKRLFSMGFRYTLHNSTLPGRPDIVLPRYRVTIQINGCFWHYHGCHLSTLPKSRVEWWRNKLEKNRARDKRTVEALLSLGWRVLVVWECSFRGRAPHRNSELDRVSWMISDFIKSDKLFLELLGPSNPLS